MKTADIAPFFAILKAANPQPRSELEYSNAFELLAAVLLSGDLITRQGPRIVEGARAVCAALDEVRLERRQLFKNKSRESQ